MSLDILRQKVKRNVPGEALPEWVTEGNLTIQAFESIKKLKAKKLEYIGLHNMKSHYKTKKFYQISASEVARKVGCATVTLNNSSAYSLEFKAYLAAINEELEREKEKAIQTHKRTLSAGMKQRKKDEISSELQIVRKELEELKKKNTEEQVSLVLNSLSLPVRHKLGID